jgi:hypothetical protein
MVSNLGFRRIAVLGGVAGLVLAFACSNKDANTDGGISNCSPSGAAASGPPDTHCIAPDGGAIVQLTSQASCYVDAAPGGDDGGGSSSGGDDGGTAGDAGGSTADAGDIGNCGDDAYGPTMYGQSGADDDCKYDMSWTSTPICENQNVYFTVTATKRTDHSPLTGANVRPDVVLNCSHPIPNNPTDPSPETTPGTYTVGPIVFDQPGKWVVRFHFFENCYDIAHESPHGHAAFYVQVP